MRRFLWVLLTLSGIAQAAESPATAPISSAVQTCLETAADLSAVYPTTTFPAGTRELFAAIDLGKPPRPGKISSVWIAVDVGAVASPNQQIAKADLKVAGSERVRLKYSQPKALPPGKYRLEISADEK